MCAHINSPYPPFSRYNQAILQKISNDPTINRLNPTIMDMAKAIYTSSAPLSQTSGMERQGSSKPKMPRRNTLNAETRLSVAQSSKRPQYLDVKSSSMISPSITHAQVHGEKVQISSSTSSRTSSSSFDESKRSSSSVAESEVGDDGFSACAACYRYPTSLTPHISLSFFLPFNLITIRSPPYSKA